MRGEWNNGEVVVGVGSGGEVAGCVLDEGDNWELVVVTEGEVVLDGIWDGGAG